MTEENKLVRATVVGSCRVAGVEPGGTVELDPELVNVPALVEGGHIELQDTPAAAPAPGAKPRQGAATGGGPA